MAQFSTTPTMQVVTEGTVSSFECRHPHADIITWTINETSLSSYATPDIVSYTDGPLHTLHITARLVYNTSTVQCLAIFLNGQQSQVLSPAAELIIQGLVANQVTKIYTLIFLTVAHISVHNNNNNACIQVYSML